MLYLFVILTLIRMLMLIRIHILRSASKIRSCPAASLQLLRTPIFQAGKKSRHKETVMRPLQKFKRQASSLRRLEEF